MSILEILTLQHLLTTRMPRNLVNQSKSREFPEETNNVI